MIVALILVQVFMYGIMYTHIYASFESTDHPHTHTLFFITYLYI